MRRFAAVALAGCAARVGGEVPVDACLDYVLAVQGCHERAGVEPPEDVEADCLGGGAPELPEAGWRCRASLWAAGDCTTDEAREALRDRERDCPTGNEASTR